MIGLPRGVTVYAFDESDPVLQTWSKAFPGAVQPASAISESLRSHFRYPEDLFVVQTNMWGRYHLDDPDEATRNSASRFAAVAASRSNALTA